MRHNRDFLCLALASLPLVLASPAAAQVAEYTCNDFVRPSGSVQDDGVGSSVSIDGDCAWLTAPGASGPGGAETGAAFVYEFDGSFWNETQRIDPPNLQPMERAGSDVALVGTTAVLGHPAGSSERGAAFVYERQAAGWILMAVLSASDGAAGDHFGQRVASDGTTIVVSAPDQGQGAAYVFERSGATWVEAQKVVPTGVTEHFGSDVAVAGDAFVVGADRDSNLATGGGAGFVFERAAGGSWSQVQKLTGSIQPDQGNNTTQVGFSVDIEGGTIVLGANNAGNTQHQFVWVFERSAGGWPANETYALEPPPGITLFFGRSVAIDADRIAVGTSFSFNVYLFRRQPTGGFAYEANFSSVIGAAIDLSGSFLLDGLRIGFDGGSSFHELLEDRVTNTCDATPNSGGNPAQTFAQCTGVGRNAFRLIVRRAVPNTSGLFFYGGTGPSIPFGDGIRCVSTPLRIPGIQATNHNGAATTMIDLEAPPFDSGAGAITAGSTWSFQFWFRDAPAGGSGFNASGGIEIEFAP